MLWACRIMSCGGSFLPYSIALRPDVGLTILWPMPGAVPYRRVLGVMGACTSLAYPPEAMHCVILCSRGCVIARELRVSQVAQIYSRYTHV